MEFQIISPDVRYLDLLVDLFDRYRIFYGQESDLNGARNFIAERMEAGDSQLFLALELETEKPLGFTQLYPTFTSVGMRRQWILNDLYVAESARRSGVAKALLKAGEDFARENGAIRIVLETTPDNSKAQALYDREEWLRDHNTYWYYKPLDQ